MNLIKDKWDYIKLISKASNRYGNKLLKLLHETEKENLNDEQRRKQGYFGKV